MGKNGWSIGALYTTSALPQRHIRMRVQTPGDERSLGEGHISTVGAVYDRAFVAIECERHAT